MKYGNVDHIEPQGRPGDGRANHPLYGIYMQMIRRCTNPAYKAWQDYGGRGIKVCDEWMNDFWAFVNYMPHRPSNTSIDRIDNDGDYEPGNVKWSTRLEQANNRRPRSAKVLKRCEHCGHVL
jgi:hypothetical protein